MLEIVYRNEHFVAVNKPAGQLSVPSRMGSEDPRSVTGLILQDQLNQRIFPIHRLDLEVRGLLLFALTNQGQRAGNSWFEKHLARKTYWAWAHGILPHSSQVLWKNKLLRGKKRSYESPHGQQAVTEAECLGQEIFLGEKALHWRLHPITGRPHQLRVHLSQHGFPIVGDVLYGGAPSPTLKGIALAARELDLSAVPSSERLGLPQKIQLEGPENWA